MEHASVADNVFQNDGFKASEKVIEIYVESINADGTYQIDVNKAFKADNLINFLHFVYKAKKESIDKQ